MKIQKIYLIDSMDFDSSSSWDSSCAGLTISLSSSVMCVHAFLYNSFFLFVNLSNFEITSAALHLNLPSTLAAVSLIWIGLSVSLKLSFNSSI